MKEKGTARRHGSERDKKENRSVKAKVKEEA